MTSEEKKELLKTSIRHLELDEEIQAKLFSLDIKDVETLVSYCEDQKSFNDFIKLLQSRLHKYYDIEDYLLIRKLKHAVHMIDIKFPYEEKNYRKIQKNKRANISDLDLPSGMLEKLIRIVPSNSVRDLLKVSKQELLNNGLGNFNIKRLVEILHNYGLIFDFECVTQTKDNVYDASINKVLEENITYIGEEMTMKDFINKSVYDIEYDHCKKDVDYAHSLGLVFLYEDPKRILDQDLSIFNIDRMALNSIKKSLNVKTVRDICEYTKEELYEKIGEFYTEYLLEKFSSLGVIVKKKKKQKRVKEVSIETLEENQEEIQEYNAELLICKKEIEALEIELNKRIKQIEELYKIIDEQNKLCDKLLNNSKKYEYKQTGDENGKKES